MQCIGWAILKTMRGISLRTNIRLADMSGPNALIATHVMAVGILNITETADSVTLIARSSEAEEPELPDEAEEFLPERFACSC